MTAPATARNRSHTGWVVTPEPADPGDLVDELQQLDDDDRAVAEYWLHVRDVAAQLGHRNVVVVPTKSGRRYSWGCDCIGGLSQATRATRVEAARAARSHLERSVREFEGTIRSYGVSRPARPAGR